MPTSRLCMKASHSSWNNSHRVTTKTIAISRYSARLSLRSTNFSVKKLLGAGKERKTARTRHNMDVGLSKDRSSVMCFWIPGSLVSSQHTPNILFTELVWDTFKFTRTLFSTWSSSSNGSSHMTDKTDVISSYYLPSPPFFWIFINVMLSKFPGGFKEVEKSDNIILQIFSKALSLSSLSGWHCLHWAY